MLGPLVYGCAFWPVSVGEAMREKFGFTDSKKLTAEQRDTMYEQIQQMEGSELGYFSEVI